MGACSRQEAPMAWLRSGRPALCGELTRNDSMMRKCRGVTLFLVLLVPHADRCDAGDQDDLSLDCDAAGVYSIAFNPTGDTLAAGCSAGRIILWRFSDGQPRLTLQQPAG